MKVPINEVSDTVEREIFASINFRESPTNMPGKQICDLYFRDKVTMSDHTPYISPHGNGGPRRVFSTSKR